MSMSEPLPPTSAELEVGKAEDATKRALRTFLVSIGFDVLTAVVLLLLPIFTSAQGWSDFDWELIGFALVKTVVVSIFSFVLRYFKVVPRTL